MSSIINLTSNQVLDLNQSNVSIYGNSGNEIVNLSPGVSGVVVDINVESVTFPGNVSDYQLNSNGNTLLVFQGSLLLATIPIQTDSDGTQLTFNNGNYNGSGTYSAHIVNNQIKIAGLNINPVITGDGKSQLLGTSGDDTFYPSGFVNQELTLSPGNDTFNLGAADNYQLSLIPVNFTPSSGASINLTSTTVTVGSIQLKPNTIDNGYGGTDAINFTDPINSYTLYFWSGPSNDYLIKNTGSVYWDVQPNSGNDTVISNGGFLEIDFFNFAQTNITISGNSGKVQPDANTTINYSGVTSWSFWNGNYNIIGTVSNEILNFWNVYTSYNNQTVKGGGDNETFIANTSNLTIKILDFNASD
jgi:hypothetical protein